jgi:biopolymer transport protein ExbD
VWSPSQAAVRRAARRASTYYAGINVSAFVSVMLALLFLLLGDTTPDRYQKGAVDLPVAENAVSKPRALREDVMRVAVTRDGQVYFRQTHASPEELANLIRTALQEGAERKVYLAADARAKYGEVEIVLKQIRLAGIASIVILANKTLRPTI